MEKQIEILVDHKEYVTKEEVYKAINEQYHETGFDGYQDGIELMNRIAKIPAADVVEVRHGKWCTTDAYPHNIYCSECYGTYAQEHWGIWKDGTLPRDYCPKCGAKMDGGQ